MAGCSKNENKTNEAVGKVTLMVSAAVSLTDALEEIKVLYEKNRNIELTFNLGGSGSLAQQIQQGAPVDVFISANQQWLDTLQDEDMIINHTRKDITGNKLVLIAGKTSEINYDSIESITVAEIDQIAIGNPESVPAGKYTEQVLKHYNLWDELKSKVVLGKDVRQVLTYVETGNVNIGFVYESDALSSNDINILATATKDSHDPIIYPGAVLKDTKHKKEATDFMTFMSTDEVQKILMKHGFSM